MLINVRFKWKLINDDIREMSFNGYPSLETARDSFEDFWNVTPADCEYFEYSIEEVQ